MMSLSLLQSANSQKQVKCLPWGASQLPTGPLTQPNPAGGDIVVKGVPKQDGGIDLNRFAHRDR